MISRPDDRAPTPSSSDLIVVCVMGAESTGKTTLARALAAELDWPWVPEAARRHVEIVGRPAGPFDLDRIVRRHVGAFDAARVKASVTGAPGVILDTDPVASWAYSAHYNGFVPAWLKALTASRKADLYLVCATDAAFEPQDAQRGTPADRAAVQTLMEGLIQHLDAAHVPISGEPAVRLQAALGAIDGRWPNRLRNRPPRA